MKKKLNRKGFTLVELIVVIAILAILAGVAIPVYSGYIQKANEAADYQQLDAIKTAAVFVFTEDNVKNGREIADVETISVQADEKTVALNGSVTVNGTESVTNVTTYFGGDAEITFKSDTFKDGAVWDGTAWAPIG